jgi:hypothetical protein
MDSSVAFFVSFLPPTGAKTKFLTNPQKHVIGRKAFTGAKTKFAFIIDK